MERNEFEKNLKELFNNWEVPPSPKAWQQIKNRLPKPNGNLFFWGKFLAAMLILGLLSVIGWYLVCYVNNTTTTKQQVSPIAINTTNQSAKQNNNKISSSNNDTELKNDTLNSKVSLNHSRSILEPLVNKENHSYTIHDKQTHKKHVTQMDDNTDNVAFNKNVKIKADKNAYLESRHNDLIAAHSRIDIPFVSNSPSNLLANTPNIKIQPIDASQIGLFSNSALQPKKINARVAVQWSMYMDNGASWQSEIPSDNVVLRDDDANDRKTIKYTYSYRFGVGIAVPLIKGFSISGGLAYTSLSTHRLLGELVNYQNVVRRGNEGFMQVNSYYINNSPNGMINRYTTHQNFIEIPISIGFQVNPQSRLPISLNVGASILKQLYVDDIYYDKQSNIFYKDNALTQPTQWHFNASAQIAVWKNNQFNLNVGPYYQIGLGTAYRESLMNMKRWQMLGIRLNFGFKAR